jgi:HlyD family secretion protein
MAEIAKTKSRLDYAEQQLTRTTYLESRATASQQALDQAENDAASARADVAEAQANYDAAVAGPTKEERGIADAQVKAAVTALAVLERQLDKSVLRAPADGIVSVIVGEVGENIHTGQPVLVIEATGKQWLSFNVREDMLHGLTVIQGRRCTSRRTSRRQHWSTETTRSVRSRSGKPSAPLAITIAIHCACALIRRVMRPISRPA